MFRFWNETGLKINNFFLHERGFMFFFTEVKTVLALMWIGLGVPLIFEFGVEWIWIRLYGVGWNWG